jgi:hypothetical protein
MYPLDVDLKLTRDVWLLVRHPNLRTLRLIDCELDEKMICTLLESTSLTALGIGETIASRAGIPLDTFHSALLRNHTLIHIKFAWLSAEEHTEVIKIITRNQHLLHHWQCVVFLVTSYRANKHSPIRDSVLTLVPQVMWFLDYDVVRDIDDDS